MTEEAGEFAGVFYEDANKLIIEKLQEVNALLNLDYITYVIHMIDVHKTNYL